MDRLASLDVLRGLSILGMIMVISPGSFVHNPSWLRHAPWEGIVVVDMIFPAFLFCMGMALPLSLNKHGDRTSYQHYINILLRSSALIILGVLLNIPLSSDLSHLRIPGVLQRLGFCYALCASLFVFLTSKNKDCNEKVLMKTLSALVVSIVFVYWFLLAFIPVPGGDGDGFGSEWSWPAFIDRALFGVDHMWPYGTTDGRVTFDPDGFLSSIPACINVLGGIIAALIMKLYTRSAFIRALFYLAVISIVISLLFSFVCPIIKNLWTSSFALFSLGFSFLMLATLESLLSVKPALAKIVLYPLKVYGSNALLAFVISWLMLGYLDKPIKLAEEAMAIRGTVFNFYLQLVESQQLASLMFTASVVLVIYLILQVLYFKRWYIRL